MTNFKSDRHALYAGCILGIAAKHGVPLDPVIDDEGNYTATVVLDITSGISIKLVVPEPPEDWSLAEWMGS